MIILSLIELPTRFIVRNQDGVAKWSRDIFGWMILQHYDCIWSALKMT